MVCRVFKQSLLDFSRLECQEMLAAATRAVVLALDKGSRRVESSGSSVPIREKDSQADT
jgi:hypothetical protein